jgi:cyclopropane fatty-acyl-phospholipid synthase-like methyltransferase
MQRPAPIVDYYNQTHLGYRLFWGLNRTHSMHYGLHDSTHRTHDKAVTNLIRFLSITAKMTAADEVLDVGCGFGGSSLWLARNLGCRVTGVDINPTEIASARAQAKRMGVDHLTRFIELDYARMSELEAASFSVVWQVETLIYADRRRFLFDSFERLRPGGRLIIADYFTGDADGGPEGRAVLDRWVRGWAGRDLISGDQFLRWMSEAGFTAGQLLDRSREVLPSARRMSRVCRVTAPVGRALELVGVRTPLQTENSIGAVLQYDALRRGLWRYGIVAGRKPS